MNTKYRLVSLEDRWDLFDTQDEVCSRAWPEFMLQDPVCQEWMTYIEGSKKLQLLMMDGDEILAIINTIPLIYKGELKNLPEEGWDWGFLRGIECIKNGERPNTLMGVQVVINPEHQGKGLSGLAVKEMKALAIKEGFENLIIPVRPANKPSFPLINIDEYIKWEKDGLPYDGWLRTHVKAGGEIIKVCHKAMYIPGTIEEWEEWTGLKFPGSGRYIVPGALNPVTVNKEKNLIEYSEPNVWVSYKIS